MAGECARRGYLFDLIVVVVALDLDVLPAQRVAGEGSGDFEQKQWSELRLEHKVTRRRNTRLHDAS
jgi:hypothetical protein